MIMRFLVLAAYLASAIAVLPVCAQVNARVSGLVVDETGQPVASARVSVGLPGGVEPIMATLTNGAGLFVLTGVRADSYTLSIEAAGFQKYAAEGIKVDPAQEANLQTISLMPEIALFRTEVIAHLDQVQSSNAQIASNTSIEQVRRLPVIDRGPLKLASTQAGVSSGKGSTVINGERASYTTVTLDGINVQDNFIRDNALNYSPNLLALDQVSEFTVVTSNASAALAGGASHIVFVTPSGSNVTHGSVYWYNRNNALAANTWFNNKDGIPRPFLNQNQAGASLGGPIKRSKLLAYVNYEAFRLRTQGSPNRTILSSDARNGIFTYRDSQGVVRKVNILQAAQVSADPAMQQILAQVPGPEKINNFRVGDSSETLLRNTAGYSFLTRGRRDRDNVTTKLDYLLSPKHTISGSFLWNRDTVTRSDLSTDYSTDPKVSNDDARRFLSTSWRWNPAPAFTNEIRGGFNLAPLTFTTSQVFGDRILTGMSYTNPVNTFRNQGRNTGTFLLEDNATYSHGRHTIQFGFQTQQIRVRSSDESGITPTYSIGIGLGNPGLSSQQLPGISAAELGAANQLLASLAGYVTGFSQTFYVTGRTSGFVPRAPNVRNYSFNNYGSYVQDSWKMTARLSLTLGLRYDLFSVVDERDSLALLPVVTNNNPIATLLSNSSLDFGGSGAGRPWYNRDKNNFAPNIGLAYKLPGTAILRAGYSLSYVNDESIAAALGNVSLNEGLTATSSQTGLTARVSSGLPPIPTPTFQIPRTFAQNYQINPFTAFGLPDPNLRTPYVQQWNLGLQHEFKQTLFELRYVGNHATKGYRSFDVNPEIIRDNGFLTDFNRAYQNGTLSQQQTGVFDPRFNANIAGSQNLTVFPQLVGGGFLTNSQVLGAIQTRQAGELAFLYHVNGLAGPIAFYRNPVSLASILIANYSNSTYDALQFDVRRRLRQGMQFQANYTYGKVLSDADGTGQSRFEEFRDPSNGKIDRSRPSFDITHAIKANAVYDLPLGGLRWSGNPFLGRLVQGWTVSGIMVWQSGSPFSVLSQRGTLLRAFRAGRNTASTILNKAQLDDILTLRQSGTGPFILAASAIGNDGRGVAPDGSAPFSGQAFFHPEPGAIGGLQQRMFSGPWTFNLDMALLKTTRLTERQSVEFRAEASNVLNNPSWLVDDQQIGSPTFGRITKTFYDRRVIQVSLRYSF